ncbi:MAG: hypothetical protein ACK2TV_11080, partial [Anaerolineales bacterium]
MKSKGLRWAVGLLGLLFLLSSLFITFIEYNRFVNTALVFPPGSMIAGVPVVGLEKDAATARVSEYYNLPLIIQVKGSTIQAAPQELGFSVDASSLVEAAAQNIQKVDFWTHLWQRATAQPIDQPLTSNINEDTIISYLESQIIPRYLQPGKPVTPI